MPRAILLALTFAAAAETGRAVPPVGPVAAPERVAADRHEEGRRTMGRLPANLGRSVIGVWSADSLVPFLAFTYTEVLKAAVGRERPNGRDEKSFASGHTSNAFALESVAQLHYGWKVGVPAALGCIVARTVVRVNSRGLDGAHRRATLSVVPVAARHAPGLQMMATF